MAAPVLTDHLLEPDQLLLVKFDDGLEHVAVLLGEPLLVDTLAFLILPQLGCLCFAYGIDGFSLGAHDLVEEAGRFPELIDVEK